MQSPHVLQAEVLCYQPRFQRHPHGHPHGDTAYVGQTRPCMAYDYGITFILFSIAEALTLAHALEQVQVLYVLPERKRDKQPKSPTCKHLLMLH